MREPAASGSIGARRICRRERQRPRLFRCVALGPKRVVRARQREAG